MTTPREPVLGEVEALVIALTNDFDNERAAHMQATKEIDHLKARIDHANLTKTWYQKSVDDLTAQCAKGRQEGRQEGQRQSRQKRDRRRAAEQGPIETGREGIQAAGDL